MPLLLNIILTLGLLYRIYIAAPIYFNILIATLGYDNPEKVPISETDWGGLARSMTERSGLFLMDFALFRGVGGWPWEFLFGVKDDGGSSAIWRWNVRFREKEIVVRRSRRWDQALLSRQSGAVDEEGESERGMREWASNGDKVERDEYNIMRDRIMPAISPTWVKTKTGYLMMDKSWDLDFGAMITAHELITASSNNIPASEKLASNAEPPFTFNTFRTQVLIHEHGKGWLIWPVWKLEEQDSGKQSTQRQKIVQMKDTLTAMGKENLFFRWVELVQFESSGEGGFTVERQQHAVKKARELFESQGVDFEEFWAAIDGGVEGMMGMEIVR